MSVQTAPALIFDLDGTPIDSVYQHVLAWHEALDQHGFSLAVRPLPGATELLRSLRENGIPHAIATSGQSAKDDASVLALEVGSNIPFITRAQVKRAKPDPDLFLAAAAALEVPIEKAMVVGDSVWDLLAARRAGCLGIGVLSGGYGREELQQVGEYRVYRDPADLLAHLDEVGIRTAE